MSGGGSSHIDRSSRFGRRLNTLVINCFRAMTEDYAPERAERSL
jgi:hypothetical protein